MKNKKGFAFAGIMYTVLIVFALLMVSMLVGLQNRKNILSQLKFDTAEALENSTEYNYLLAEITALQTLIGTTNISSIADGTVTGAISEIDSNLQWYVDNGILPPIGTVISKGYLSPTSAVASSTWSGYPATQSYDGNVSTSWLSASGVTSSNIVYQFEGQLIYYMLRLFA
ncbi:MAG: hypothetical protein PHN42_02910 [Bacilli bacterium]|nr:hypothetical protein [Bacilli bacterium]